MCVLEFILLLIISVWFEDEIYFDIGLLQGCNKVLNDRNNNFYFIYIIVYLLFNGDF